MIILTPCTSTKLTFPIRALPLLPVGDLNLPPPPSLALSPKFLCDGCGMHAQPSQWYMRVQGAVISLLAS